MTTPMMVDPNGRSSAESFYHLRDGPLIDHACEGTACYVARQSLGPESPNRPLTEPRIYCFGRCFEAPAKGPCHRRPMVHVDAPEAVVLGRMIAGGARTLTAYRKFDGYKASVLAFANPPHAIIESLEFANLRGRGGAGFSTGRKWRAAAEQPSGTKFIVANADEGDSGAYIDRFLMEDDPFALIEGMTLAAYAIGAQQGWIYLRREYPYAKEVLEKALREARSAGLLGPRILGHLFDFDIEVVVGQGGYLCGEETALLRSIEGRRPEVAARPPYLTTKGLFGRSTVVNNVETLVTVPWIISHGAAAFRALGFSQSRGTKVVSLNSLFMRPGLYEVEFGASVRHIVEELGGGLRSGTMKGVIIGGPLAGIIPPHLLETRFGFEELRAIGANVGHGGTIGFDEKISIVALLHHVFGFGAFESCGKCTPCRLGSRRIEEILSRLLAGKPAAKADSRELRNIVSALKWTSLCGHGVGLAEFAESVMRYYGEELEKCLA